MYLATLALHSVVRWVILIAGIAAVVRAITGRSAGRPWTTTDDAIARSLAVAVNVQFVLGVLLYGVLSPLTAVAMRDFGAAMGTPVLRYWAVEHVTGGLVATALIHIGRARIRRAADDQTRHRLAAIFFGLGLLILLASVPWPGLANGRPLFPGL